jgi:nitroreductase
MTGGVTAKSAIASSAMHVADAIGARRTHKNFTERPVTRAEIEAMLDAAVLAPNHKLTEPWRFAVLGPHAKQQLGSIRARVKCGVPADGEVDAHADRRASIVQRTSGLPAIIAVVMHQAVDATRREEDYAATFMAIQNMLLTATSLGLGTKVSTGKVLEDDELQALLRLRDDERCVALIHVGEPAEQRVMQPRVPAADRTVWLD